MTASQTLNHVLNRNLIFVHGKGGVGKTAISQAIALSLSKKGKRVLWIEFESPVREPGDLLKYSDTLWSLNCEATDAFAEYMGLLIKVKRVARLFVKNKLIQYLSRATPGIHEIVLLGKVWYERLNYDHVVIDLPSTGYGIAMFQSTLNFSRLFKGGPVHRDTEKMDRTLGDSEATGHLVLALPEEMPLQEALELNQHLMRFFPKNPSAFLVNRVFPNTLALLKKEMTEGREISPYTPNHSEHPSPVAASALDYVQQRALLERENLKLWEKENLQYGLIEHFPPGLDVIEEERHSGPPLNLVQKIADDFNERAYL
jgi:anion-transporting  ArsA/GET3 family ATPase